MRLSIELSPEQHYQIKAMAALQGKTIRDLVLDRIFNQQKEEDVAWEEFMALLGKRIANVRAGKLSARTPHEIAQEVLRRNNAI